MWLTVVFLSTLLIMMYLVSVVDGCPSKVCVCKWKGGKQTVECGDRLLSRIPEGMDPSTQVLNFSGNDLTILQSERFKKMDLINLQKIYMARNQLLKIHDRAFEGLTNLVELDLSENMLPVVPTETFADYPALMRLTLSRNPIRTLRTNAFKQLSFLTTLELSNCQINTIEDEAFIGMNNLEWLRLDGNRITTIQGNHVLPKSLHGINLQANLWQCDCRLLDVHNWLNSFNVPQREEPKCSGPVRHAGKTIRSITQEDLACLPVITPNSLYREITAGHNLTLTCRITAIPEATVSWWFQGQMLQYDDTLAPNLHLYHYNGDSGEEKRSELLIFNTSPDENGTFTCVAENSAGQVQAKYTLHVIMKEEPVVEETTSSQEHFLMIVGVSAATGFLLFLLLCFIVGKCCIISSKRTSSKKSRGMPTSNSNTDSQKCSSITYDIAEPPTSTKMNGSVMLSASNPQDVVLYLNNGSNLDNDDPSCHLALNEQAQSCSLPSTRSYHDQNPDLINDAEKRNKIRPRPDVGDKESDKNKEDASYQQRYCQPSAQSTLSRGIKKDLYQHQVDIHLNPGCYLDQNGYPIDLKLMADTVQGNGSPSTNYSRTLPYKRGQKSGAAYKGRVRFANDAEFITQTSQTYQFLGGFPEYPQQPGSYIAGTSQFLPLPNGYTGELPGGLNQVAYTNSPAAAYYVGPIPPQQWPAFLPGYHPQLIQIPSGQQDEDFIRYLPPPPVLPQSGGDSDTGSGLSSSTVSIPVQTKCVGAQTSDPLDEDVILEQREEEDGTDNENGTTLRHLSGPLADSPDEGYVGDSHESTDICHESNPSNLDIGSHVEMKLPQRSASIHLQMDDIPL